MARSINLLNLKSITNRISGFGFGSLPGGGTAYRLLGAASPKSKRQVQYDGDTVTIIPSRSGVERALYWRGEYEPMVCDIIHDQLETGDVAIDVGAHVGHHAISMRQAVGDSGTILAIEPDPRRATILRETTQNHSNVQPLELGISDDREDGSLSQNGIPTIGDTNSSAVTVPLTTLDLLISEHGFEEINLLKMDIEGHETSALAGLEQHIDCVQSLIIEIHTEDILEEQSEKALSNLVKTLNHFDKLSLVEENIPVTDLEKTIQDNSRTHLFCRQ